MCVRIRLIVVPPVFLKATANLSDNLSPMSVGLYLSRHSDFLQLSYCYCH
jgi:hypothetical protein